MTLSILLVIQPWFRLSKCFLLIPYCTFKFIISFVTSVCAFFRILGQIVLPTNICLLAKEVRFYISFLGTVNKL